MTIDDELASVIDASMARVGADVEFALFASSDPRVVADQLLDHVRHRLGTVTAVEFYRAGVGVVVGLRLGDGRGVVVKVHRWNVTMRRLDAIQRVQAQLAAALPAPRPIDRPARLGRGIATIEELRAAGHANGHEPGVRREIARCLHQLVAASIAIASDDVGSPSLMRRPDEPLWPEPHDVRFDFDATLAGAEWIDDCAREARYTLAATRPGPSSIGHFDWRTENLGFSGGRIVAIYDWDSLGVADEPVIVGANAAHFCANWPMGQTVASIAEMAAFVDDYQLACGRPFDDEQTARLVAARTASIAYGARCQHSDRMLRPDIAASNDSGWIDLLHAVLDSA